MNDVRDRFAQFLSALPVGQRISIGAALIGLVMVAVWFFSWVTSPDMTVLASGLDSANLASVVDQLETTSTPYEIGGGGTTVMVPRDVLYETRAQLAQSGVASGEAGEGWEILDDQGIAISDFQQQTNYQRALQGELERTLVEMDGIDGATVHLVLPEDRLFTEQQEPRTASVLLDTARDLRADEVEAVVFLVSSAVEGLSTSEVTVADANGEVLHAPGDSGGATTSASRQMRETRAYEQALASDIQGLLATATGSTASVVVRATLDFDDTSTAVRTFDPDSQVATAEQTIDETYVGEAPGTDGVVGVDGGPIDAAVDGSSTDYARSEVLRQFGVSETTTTTTQAPGKVESLSVAIVMDDGSLTGAAVPVDADVSALVAAAVGLDEARGDTVAVTRVPFPVPGEEAEDGLADGDMMGLVTQAGALLVLVVVAVALFLMSRRRDEEDDETGLVAVDDPRMAELEALLASQGTTGAVTIGPGGERVLVADAVPVDVTVGGARRTPPISPVPPDDTARREVEALVDRQPEEIANLLRSWLADTR